MVSRNIVLQDISSNHLTLYPKAARKSADTLIADYIGGMLCEPSVMVQCQHPLYEPIAPFHEEEITMEEFILSDATMERCVESIIRSDSPVVGSGTIVVEECKQPSVPVESVSTSSASFVAVNRVRRRSPLVEVTIDSDNDGTERETVLAGHVHIEDDCAVSSSSEISCDDESESDFFRLCDHEDTVEEESDDISISAFVDLLSFVDVED